jgi:predicted Zn-dependent protease
MYIMLALDGRRDDGVFAIPHGGRKLGMKLFDPRVTISTDPMDPDGGYLPFGFGGSFTQYVPVKWIENGVLKALEFPTRAMAAEYGIDMYPNPYAYRMSGGTETVEEMIAATTRGIYVTRFSDVSTISGKTLFMTGVTRDGTFLIEHGKITKPIKNLRFEDSPMFFLNNLLAMGVPKRVLAPFAPSVVPPIMVQDFAFTSLTDSV